ncbi:hypothetical protein P9112_013389 [Eukaryota sp. TZLM1-RC]
MLFKFLLDLPFLLPELKITMFILGVMVGVEDLDMVVSAMNPNPNVSLVISLVNVSLSGVIDITTGSRHGLAVLSNGKVKDWGSNGNGRLGNGVSIGYRILPGDVDTFERVEKAIGCHRHSLFITENHELLTTGHNHYGQLCLGYEDDKHTPTSVLNFNVVQASCGNRFTIFLTKEGDVYSCGDVLGRTTDSTLHHTPGKVQGLGRVRSIGSGRNIAFAVDFNNVLFSWEEGDHQASINAETKDYEVGSVFAGDEHFFIYILLPSIQSPDDSLLVVNGTLSNESPFTIHLNILVNVQALGSVYCSGLRIAFNKLITNEGLLKANDKAHLSFPGNLSLLGGIIMSELPIIIGDSNKIVGYGVLDSTLINFGIFVSTGEFSITNDIVLHDSSQVLFEHSLLNMNSPALFVQGKATIMDRYIGSAEQSVGFFKVYNLHLFGKVEFINVNLTVLNLGTLSGQVTVTKAVISVDHGATLVIDGKGSATYNLKAWGSGEFGRTGTGDTTNPYSPLSVISDEVFTSISCGAFHTLGLTSEGTFFAWGRNHLGELGLGYESDPYYLPEPVDFNNVVQISAGSSFSLARTQDNHVYSWGSGSFGRLGHGDEDDQPQPKPIASLENVINISAGRYHSLAVLSNRKVKAWGWNEDGRLGDGTNTDRDIPVDVNVTERVEIAICCHAHSLFITEIGDLMSTGNNFQGKLCLGDVDVFPVPGSPCNNIPRL